VTYSTGSALPAHADEQTLFSRAAAEGWDARRWLEFDIWVHSQEPTNWARLRELHDWVWGAHIAERTAAGQPADPVDTTWWGAAANCVMNHENRGRIPNLYYGGRPWRAYRISDASGLFQFISTTWNGYGGYRNAADAPPLVQLDKFNEVWAGGRGRSHWAGTGC
jgi:hypothetical protein